MDCGNREVLLSHDGRHYNFSYYKYKYSYKYQSNGANYIIPNSSKC